MKLHRKLLPLLLSGVFAGVSLAPSVARAQTTSTADTTSAEASAEKQTRAELSKAWDARDWAQALILVDVLLQANPQDGKLTRQKGFFLGELGRMDEAVAAYHRSTELAPNDVQSWNGLCRKLIVTQRLQDARATCERSVTLEKGYANTVNLGHTYLLAGDAQNAYSWYRESLLLIESKQDLNEGPLADFDLFIQRGWQANDSEQAKQWFAQGFSALKEDQNNYDQMVALRREGEYTKALPLAIDSLAISEKFRGAEHPDTASRLNQLAMIRKNLGETTIALPLYKRALAISEKSPDYLTNIYRGNLASLYKTIGNYAQALPLTLQVLATHEKEDGMEHTNTGDSLNNLAGLYRDMGEYAKALPLYQRALAISEKAIGPEHPSTGTRLNNLAGLYRAMGDYAQALPLYQRALAISEKAEGPEHPSTGTSLNDLAALYRDMGDYAQALPLYQRVLAIAEKVLGPEHPSTGTLLNNLALLYQAMSDYANALPLFQRALAISEKAEGPEHPSTGTRLNNLAALYKSMGDYAQALPLFQRALAISEKAEGPEHPSTGTSLNDLAVLYHDMGDYAQALPLYQRALAISEKAQGPEHPDTGTHLNNLARLYRAMGDYAQALPLFQRALAISEKAQGPEHPSTGTSLNDLAELYRAMGDYAQALPLYQRALAISEKAEGPEHPSTGTRLNNLAFLYQDMGDYAQALPLYQRALTIFEKANGPEHPSTGTSLNNLAFLYQDMGDYAQALPLYQRALAISEKAEGPEHPSTGTSLNNLARLYKDMGDTTQALPLHERALAILLRHGSSPYSLIRVQEGLARTYHAQSQPALAILYGKQAINTLQSLRTGMKSMDADLQKSFLKKNEDIYQTVANWLIEAGRIPEAEQVLAMLKEKELADLVKRSDTKKTTADYVGPEKAAAAEGDALAARGVKESAELAQLERRMKNGEKLPEADEARRAELLRAAQVWRDDYQKWITSLQTTFAASKTAVAPDTAQQGSKLQTLVRNDPGAVGLHYVVTDERIAIIVATARGSFGRSSAVKRSELNREIAALRQAIDKRGDTGPASQALYKMLIGPVEADLRDAEARTLVLSLTDTLRYLPFAALNDGNHYLIERYALSLYASAGNTRPQSSKTAWQVAGMGVTEGVQVKDPNRGLDLAFSALPAVKGELEGIVKAPSTQGILPGSIALDEQLTPARFEDALMGATNVVHVASHFNFKPGDENGSVLLLGKGQTISLKSLAVMDFNQVEQLTLSACNTATGGGTNENGAEVEGLAAAVQQQGAQSVLATLWPVADASTAKLMRDFYTGHAQTKPLTRAEALRQAQLALLQGGSAASRTVTDANRGAKRVDQAASAAASTTTATATDPAKPFAHPYFWAPFVLSGNWM